MPSRCSPPAASSPGSTTTTGADLAMATTMTADEIRDFLLRGTRTAKLATVMADGTPHVAPVWFVLDGEQVVFTTPGDSVKYRNLRREPRMAIAVDDEEPPFAFVQIRGVATLSTDL